MNETIVNRVAESGIITLNLEHYYPKDTVEVFDIKSFLFMELILKEKDFRETLKKHDWSLYTGKNVAVYCSVDAIIPVWAYMLVGSYLQPYALNVVFGSKEQVIQELLLRNIRAIEVESFRDKRVVIKGCGDLQIDEKAYLEITLLLRPVVISLMFGEPCSTVPVYKASSVRKV